jgi:hypothetical protein
MEAIRSPETSLLTAHSITSQKTAFFIAAIVGTSNLVIVL